MVNQKKGRYPEEPMRTQVKTSEPPKAREKMRMTKTRLGLVLTTIDSGASFLDQS